MRVSAVIGAALWRAYRACDYGELARSAPATPQICARNTSPEGTTNGTLGVDAGG
jgi:hypothetical protein